MICDIFSYDFFKNSKSLDKKNADSIAVSCDILKISPKQLKPHCDYILVYNIQKNQIILDSDNLEVNNEIQQSLEYNKIGSWSTKLAKKEYVAFGLLRDN